MKLYIKLNVTRVCIAYATVIKTTIHNQKGLDYDIKVTSWPEDFKSIPEKYIIDTEGVFTMRERYDEYIEYLEEFNYGLEGEFIPETYENWLLL